MSARVHEAGGFRLPAGLDARARLLRRADMAADPRPAWPGPGHYADRKTYVG